MDGQLTITHYYHSGFSVEWKQMLFVFDYWRGENRELPEKEQLKGEDLKAFQQVFVFISHEHMDHMDPVVFEWQKVAPVQYYVSSDMPVGTRGKRMAPGSVQQLAENVTVEAFDSTDLGVSFLLNLDGLKIFHAGDLNFWHWREESTMKEIEEAETDFRKAVQPLCDQKIDIAFFPVDPRQGAMFEAGADYFILSVKPRLLIPMHYFHRDDIAAEYARTGTTRSTQVLPLTGYGKKCYITVDEEGYMNLSFQDQNAKNEPEAGELHPADEPFTGEDSPISDDNPFEDSDLPVPQLSLDPEQPENTNEDRG